MTFTFPKRSSAKGGTSAGRLTLRRPVPKPTWPKEPLHVPVPHQPEPLSMDDVVDFFKSSCKPESQWRIGTEHEKFVFNKATASRATYEEIRYILQEVVDRHGWEAMYEGENLIGCVHDGKSITLEGGGQMELSGRPLQNCHEMRAELQSHLRQVRKIGREIGVGFVGFGTDPITPLEDVPWMPKRRYGLVERFLQDHGRAKRVGQDAEERFGMEMLFNTTSTQVNLDYCSESDMIEKLRLSLALHPAVTALFSNSSVRAGADSAHSSWRSKVYLHMDDRRCDLVPFVFSDDFGFEAYAEYVVDEPMVIVHRGGVPQPCYGGGHTFRDFLEGGVPMLPGEQASMHDFEIHLSTFYPEVRLKKYLEMRGADCGSEGMIAALPALWVGLLYDATARAECRAIIQGWTVKDMQEQRRKVPADGLRAVVNGVAVSEVAGELLRIARGGLTRRGLGEGIYLEPLDEIIAAGESHGEAIARRYRGEWAGCAKTVLRHAEV